MLDVGAASECLDIFGDEIENLVEPFPDTERRAGERIDEGGGDAMALSMPFVFLRDGASHKIETGI